MILKFGPYFLLKTTSYCAFFFFFSEPPTLLVALDGERFFMSSFLWKLPQLRLHVWGVWIHICKIRSLLYVLVKVQTHSRINALTHKIHHDSSLVVKVSLFYFYFWTQCLYLVLEGLLNDESRYVRKIRSKHATKVKSYTNTAKIQ